MPRPALRYQPITALVYLVSATLQKMNYLQNEISTGENLGPLFYFEA